MLEWLGPLGGILLVDLVLSGDNALVIGAASSSLPRKQRMLAILCGGSAAVVLRVLFAILATFLLELPWLQAIGGVALLFIAVKLLTERSNKGHEDATTPLVKKSFLASLLTILVADVTMSLDNVLAVGALADGHWLLLTVGLIISVGLVLVGSALISELIGRLPWLMDVASLVLAWTAANMLLDDLRLRPLLEQIPWPEIVVPALALVLVLLADLLLWRRQQRLKQQAIAR